MIVEQRTYSLKPSDMADFIDLYLSHGYEIQTKHLGKLLDYYKVEIGPLNRLVQQWEYVDLDDRAVRRARLEQDDSWSSFIEKALPLIIEQRSMILRSILPRKDPPK